MDAAPILTRKEIFGEMRVTRSVNYQASDNCLSLGQGPQKPWSRLIYVGRLILCSAVFQTRRDVDWRGTFCCWVRKYMRKTIVPEINVIRRVLHGFCWQMFGFERGDAVKRWSRDIVIILHK